jgi:hypothetical protein
VKHIPVKDVVPEDGSAKVIMIAGSLGGTTFAQAACLRVTNRSKGDFATDKTPNHPTIIRQGHALSQVCTSRKAAGRRDPAVSFT